ncbi:MAG: glucosaminidase domain-containing protein [Ferruginibacter sp.]
MKQLIIAILFFVTGTAAAQETLTPEQYVALYKDLAIREMKRMGVPAAITLAQGILETESGNSDLVKKSNNHFGIKCKATWTAASVTHDDDATGECFRAYPSAEESYRDHSNFLRGSERYSFLFRYDVKDYKAWAYGLKKAGYATNPKYPAILIKHIEQYNLQQYSLMGADESFQIDSDKYQDDKETGEGAAAAADTTTITATEDSETLLDQLDKVLTVNGSKCVFAGRGTSLLVVATKNNVPLSKLLGCNELAEDGMLVKNQYVFLEKKSKTGDKDFYVAKGGGESLYDISQLNGIQMQYMLDYNHLWGNEEIVAGTKIYLKLGLKPAKKETVAAVIEIATEAVKFHKVQTKEGLYSIARKYNVTVQQLREWNKLNSDALTVGQQLAVSAQTK